MRPTATALPPGTALATAVVDSTSTAACGYVRPGVAATITIQYVARFQRATRPSVASSRPVIEAMAALTSEKSAAEPRR